MYYDDRSKTFNFVAGLALGAVIGASVALLAGPQSSKSRKLLRSVARQGRGKRKDLSRELRSAVRAGRSRLRL
jgi:gas vesicle protein